MTMRFTPDHTTAEVSPIVMGAAHGTPALRGMDGALQIEPPEKLTGAPLARFPGEVASQMPESGSDPRSPREPSLLSSRSEPRREDLAPTSDKGCALAGADRSVAKADPSPSCRVV